MMMKPARCWRARTDCEPLHSIEGLPENMSEADWDALESGKMEPKSFVCAGCVVQAERVIPQDAYRVCWKNDVVDELGEWDEQDLTHHVAVLGQALAIIASRRVNSGMIDVPTEQGA
jgi:hypothetical protein